MNERIRARTVRLLGEQEHVIISCYEALQSARRQGLDLVVISDGEPPICRILDAARFVYERKKTEREQAKRQRALAITTKEIQLRPVTDENDLLIKARKARGFLSEGDKVKVTVRFRGRERTHREYGRQMIERFLSVVGDHKVEKPIFDDLSDTTIILASVLSKADLVKR
jgi:translation initiation factor IF-3